MSNIYHEASRSCLPRGFATRVKHRGMLSCAEVRSIAAGEDLDALSPDLDHSVEHCWIGVYEENNTAFELSERGDHRRNSCI